MESAQPASNTVISSPPTSRRISRLGQRLVIYIVVCSLVLTVILTVLQGYLAYRDDCNALADRLEHVEKASRDSLAQALWAFDNDQIQTQLKSIISQGEIHYVALNSTADENYQIGRWDPGMIVRVMPIIYQAKNRPVGTLTVAANLTQVNQRAWRRVFFILVGQLLKIALVSLFFLAIIRHHVTRHLDAIAAHTAHLGLGPTPPLVLDRATRTPDELDDVVNALNHMQLSLSDEVTQNRAMANQLRTSEQKYRTIVETSQEGVWVIDEQNKTNYVNKRMADMLGWRADEMLGRPLFDFMDDLAIGIAETNVNRRRHGIAETHEFPLRHKSGAMVWTLMATTPLHDQNNAYIGALAMVVDITERRRIEEELRSNEERFRNLAEEVRLIPWEADAADWTFSYVGPKAKEILGYPPEAWYAQHFWAETIHPDDRNVTTTACASHAKMENNFTLEYRMQKADGDIVWLHDIVNVVRDRSGTPILLRGFMIDITERKKAQLAVLELNSELEQRVNLRTAQLAAANQELESFSYSVSHDLRAPLRSIDGFSRILLEDFGNAVGEEGTHLINRVRNASQKMGHLIDDFLRLSRTTRGDMRIVRVNLSAIAEGIVAQLREQYPDETVDVTIEPELWAQADARLIRVALENLINNAWKYSRPRATRLIEFGFAKNQEKPVYFVRDNGVGFDMANADRLFTPFQRLHSDSEFEGSGVGLATVQRVINRHGGEISAESTIGEGSCFYFTLARGA